MTSFELEEAELDYHDMMSDMGYHRTDGNVTFIKIYTYIYKCIIKSLCTLNARRPCR